MKSKLWALPLIGTVSVNLAIGSATLALANQEVFSGQLETLHRRDLSNFNQPQNRQPENRNLRPPSSESDHFYGAVDAPFSVITYMDYSCPYCRKLRPNLKRFINRSNGKINWIFRHYPLDNPPLTDNMTSGDGINNHLLESLAAECSSHIVGKQGFWGFSNALLTLPLGQADSSNRIRRAAKVSNLNYSELRKCIDNKTGLEKIKQDKKEALEHDIKGTPALIFVHNSSGEKRIVQGAASHQTLENELNILIETISKKP